jgi:hypothetical protein
VTLESDTNLLVGIIGGVFGAVMAVTLCVVLAIVCRRKSKKGESNNGGAGAQAQAAANAAPARTGEYGVIQLTMLRNSKNKDNKDNGNNKENNGALHQYDMMPDDAAAAAAPSEGTVYAASPFTLSDVPSISNYALAPAVSEYENVESENRLSSVNAPSSSHSDIV